MHRPGNEPGPPARQASILPLNHRCTVKSSRMLCSASANSVNNTCLETLVTTSPTGCRFRISSDMAPIAVQTYGGVLMGGTQRSYKTYTMSSGQNTLYGKTTPINDAQYLNSSIGDIVQIEDDLYSTKVTGYEYNITIVASQADMPLPGDLGTVPDWLPLEEVKIQYQNNVKNLLFDIIDWIIKTSCLVGLAYVAYRLCR